MGQLQNWHWPQHSPAATSRAQKSTIPPNSTQKPKPKPGSNAYAGTATKSIHHQHQQLPKLKQVTRRQWQQQQQLQLRPPSTHQRRFRKQTQRSRHSKRSFQIRNPPRQDSSTAIQLRSTSSVSANMLLFYASIALVFILFHFCTHFVNLLRHNNTIRRPITTRDSSASAEHESQYKRMPTVTV